MVGAWNQVDTDLRVDCLGVEGEGLELVSVGLGGREAGRQKRWLLAAVIRPVTK